MKMFPNTALPKYLHKIIEIKIILNAELFFERESVCERGEGAKRDGEREYQADSMPADEGLDLTTLRS